MSAAFNNSSSYFVGNMHSPISSESNPGAERELAPMQEVSTARAVQPDKHVFGLTQNAPERAPAPIFRDNYEKCFPPDSYCQETAPNARVWRVYVEEATAFDATMIGESRDGLDVMLVFAGLFSAVVTSFLVQVSQSLQADFSQMSAVLLHDLVSIQLAMADTGSFSNITSPSVNPNEKFMPDAMIVWVNGLWLVSLTASLSVAVAAVLVKQWLHHYMSLPSGTPGIRSHVRQFRFMGLEQWRVSVIIGLLPIIMHTSLALFLAGLVLFYIPLRTSLAWAVGALAVVVAILYIVSNVMPIFFPQCPYHTPLTRFVYDFLRLLHFCQRCLLRFLEERFMHHNYSNGRLDDALDNNWFNSFAKLEEATVHSLHDKFSVDALDWLFHSSSNPTVCSVVIQAIGGLPLQPKNMHSLCGIVMMKFDLPARNSFDSIRCRVNMTFGLSVETIVRVARTLWKECAARASSYPGILWRLDGSFLILPLYVTFLT
ncbi:hypothetical protein BDZ89DRAFT_393123 [Hymenopellis radicata]|nr:hypothetical protein BDZ89DRAFT_393123 [Hymenopellis radicata]